jgi:hypothetical protein
MAYEVKKLPPRKDGTAAWRLVWVKHGTTTRQYRHIPKKEYAAIGFSETMTYDEAKAFAKSINTDERMKYQETRRQAIHRRLDAEDKAEIIYLPSAFVQGFEVELAGKRNPKKLQTYWRIAKGLIKNIKIESREWSRRPEVFYNQFKDAAYSVSHCEKILHVVNLWLDYLSYKTERFHPPVPYLAGPWRTDIEEAYYAAGKPSKESSPISPEELDKATNRIEVRHYNYIYVTIWFGLRPIEVDKFHSKPPGKDTFGYRLSEYEGTKVLEVYQWKLKGKVAYHKRWKKIPVLFSEQEKALAILLYKEYKRPLTKTIKRWIKPDANNYGGRKGFEALMRSLGRSFFEIQDWLGHLDITRTWKDYKEKNKVYLEKKKP